MAGPGIVMEPTVRLRRGFALGLVAAIVVLGAILYGRQLAAPFCRDDLIHFSNHERWARPPKRLLEHFGEDFYAGDPGSGLYRPLTAATIQATAWWQGLQTWPLRAGNLLLHCVVALTAAALARRGGLSRYGAALVALLIVVHPLFSETVMEVVSRSEPQASAGVLAAAALLVTAGRARVSLGAAVDGALFFLLALLSKEGAFAALPALAVLLACRPIPTTPVRASDDDRKTRGLALLLILGSLLAVMALRGCVLGGVVGLDPAEISPLDNCLVAAGFGTRLLTGVANLGRYLQLLFVPKDLAPDYSFAAIRPLQTAGDLHFMLGAVALVAGAFWLVAAIRRRRAVESFGLLLAGSSWFLTSSIATPIGTIFAERLFHLPACGLLLALVAAADRAFAAGPDPLTKRQRRALLVALLVVAALGARTFVRVGDWKDEATLYTRALDVVPDSARVHCVVGHELSEQRQPAAAQPYFERALAIKPDYGKAMTEQAILCADRARAQHSPEALAQALAWFWLAAHAPGAFVDEQANLQTVVQTAQRAALPQSEIVRAANAIADSHRGVPLYEQMRKTLAPSGR